MASKPEKTFRLGSAQAAVFLNEGENGYFRSITLDRRYQDKDGEWQSSNSFTASQAANALASLQSAVNYVMEKKNSE